MTSLVFQVVRGKREEREGKREEKREGKREKGQITISQSTG